MKSKGSRAYQFLRIGFVLAAGLVFFEAATILFGSVAANRIWMERVEVPTASSLDLDVFNKLTAGGAIWTVRQGPVVSVQHTPCNTMASRSPENAMLVDGPAGVSKRRFVRELCDSPQGERIRAQIAVFNRGFNLAGLSDNRNASAGLASKAGIACAERNEKAFLFVPADCFPSAWTAAVLADGRQAQAVTDDAISPGEYSFLARADVGFFGNWKTVSPFSDTNTGRPADHLFGSEIAFGAIPVEVRTIGIPLSVSINGASVAVIDGKPERSHIPTASGEFRLSLDIICPPVFEGRRKLPATAETCIEAGKAGSPVGSRISLTGPDGATAKVEIALKPSTAAPAGLRALEKGKTRDPQRRVGIGTGQLRMLCTEEPPAKSAMATGETETGCKLAWLAPETLETGKKAEGLQNVSAGALPLRNAEGNLSREAFDLGIAQLLGLGKADAGSVLQAWEMSAAQRQISLTIDPDIQRLALAVLEKHHVCNTPGKCESRADLVVMDAEGQTAGDVFAAASLPRPVQGVSAWDIETFERSDPADSPLAAYAWRNYDLRATPGSSFKLVTALAASQFVLDNPDEELESVLLGTYASGQNPLEVITRRLGLAKPMKMHGGRLEPDPKFQGRCIPSFKGKDFANFNALPVAGAKAPRSGASVYCLGNNTGDSGSRAGVTSMLEQGSVSGCEPGSAVKRAGLCEALMDSSNLYFGGWALLMDARKFLRPGTEDEHPDALPDLLLSKMATRLFRNPVICKEDAASGTSPQTGCEKPNPDPLALLDPTFAFSGRARPSPLVVEAELEVSNGEPRRQRLAQAGVGIGVRASPLAMAAVAATVATGVIVRPRVVADGHGMRKSDVLEGEPVLDAPAGREQLRDQLLNQLRAGMHAVVVAGTAKKTLGKLPAHLKKSVHAKTGTAPLVLRAKNKGIPKNAGWLVGYVDPPGGNSAIRKRIAFACRVAPTRQTGGDACGPIVRDFLLALDGLQK